MTFLKSLMIVGLTFITAANLPLNDASENNPKIGINYRLPDNVKPIHYTIKIIPHLKEGNFTFDGETTIHIVVCRATRDISFHKLELRIDKDATSLVYNDFNSRIVKTPKAYSYENETQILTISFNDELLPGNYYLNMKFVGILNDELKGFFRTSYTNENDETVWLGVTHFEATSARRAFPCWDEPGLKATFEISIKHHRNYTALSNMPALPQVDENDEDDLVWTHFNTTPIMSTYLVAFVVSDYVRISNAEGTMSMWTRSELAPHTKFTLQIAERSEELLTQYTQSTDKVPKMDHVSSPNFTAGAMENWGLIIYTENEFTYNEAKDTTDQKHTVAQVVAHEMAHQWFGNIVSPLWWSYVWLNEGFASFFEYYVLDKIFEDWRMMDLFVIEKQHKAFHEDIAKMVMPITAEVNSPEEIESLFELSSYDKAPVILRMLQHVVTNEVFQNGLIRYLKTYQFNLATSDDLWDALQVALDKSNVPHDDYKIKDVMDTWITQRHYPVVLVIRNYETGEVTLKQEHFRPSMEDDEDNKIDEDKWWIPITYTTQSNPDFSNTVPTRWLRPQDQNITIRGIDPNDWIMVNLQQMGYYLVNYDETNWKKIANYLNSDNYTKIHELNRAQLINDAYHLLMANQLDISTFLDISDYLEKETEYIPWSTMFTILSVISTVFEIPGGESLKEPLLETINGLVENVGYVESPTEADFKKITRIQALLWACSFGHPECRRIATAKLEEHLTDPKTHKIPPNLMDWTFCNGMINASSSTWNKVLEIYMNNADSDYLYYLTCTESPEIIINCLNVNDSIINNKTYTNFYGIIVSKHGNKDSIFDYLLANLEQAISRGVDKRLALQGIIDTVYSKPKLDKINEFVKNNYKENEELLKDIQELIDERFVALLKIYRKFIKTVDL